MACPWLISQNYYFLAAVNQRLAWLFLMYFQTVCDCSWFCFRAPSHLLAYSTIRCSPGWRSPCLFPFPIKPCLAGVWSCFTKPSCCIRVGGEQAQAWACNKETLVWLRRSHFQVVFWGSRTWHSISILIFFFQFPPLLVVGCLHSSASVTLSVYSLSSLLSAPTCSLSHLSILRSSSFWSVPVFILRMSLA